MSRFAFTGRAKERGEGELSGPDDPQMERAMAAMEREFAGLNEDNPDPRQLGRLMRRMGQLMGQSWSAEMEEMARRLECGEDPDKLEEQFGDALDESMGAVEDGAKAPLGEATGSGRGGFWARMRRREPRRDPRVYEMSEYLESEPS